MQLNVSIDDIDHTVKIKTVDLAAALKRYQKTWEEVMESADQAEGLLFVAWNACKRKKITTLELDAWIVADVDVEVKTKVEEPDPLESSPPAS